MIDNSYDRGDPLPLRREYHLQLISLGYAISADH